MTKKELEAAEAELMRRYWSDWWEPFAKEIILSKGRPCVINPPIAYRLEWRQN